jgi:hypothetical protein
MIRLLALRLFIAVWARAIPFSDKLSKKAWKILVALQCVIFILSAGGFRESRLSSPFSSDITVMLVPPPIDSRPLLPSDLERPPDMALATTPVNRRKRAALNRRQNTTVVLTLSSVVAESRLYLLKREYARRTRRHLVITSYRRTPAGQARAIHHNLRAYGVPYVLMLYRGGPAIHEILRAYMANDTKHQDALSDIFRDLGRFIEPARTINVQLSQPEGGDYKKALLFWVSLFGLIVSPISAASTAVVAWISVHRSRADELLKQVQIEKMRLEIEQLRVELEQVRLEAERPQSRIVIAVG